MNVQQRLALGTFASCNALVADASAVSSTVNEVFSKPTSAPAVRVSPNQGRNHSGYAGRVQLDADVLYDVLQTFWEEKGLHVVPKQRVVALLNDVAHWPHERCRWSHGRKWTFTLPQGTVLNEISVAKALLTALNLVVPSTAVFGAAIREAQQVDSRKVQIEVSMRDQVATDQREANMTEEERRISGSAGAGPSRPPPTRLYSGRGRPAKRLRGRRVANSGLCGAHVYWFNRLLV